MEACLNSKKNAPKRNRDVAGGARDLLFGFWSPLLLSGVSGPISFQAAEHWAPPSCHLHSCYREGRTQEEQGTIHRGPCLGRKDGVCQSGKVYLSGQECCGGFQARGWGVEVCASEQWLLPAQSLIRQGEG